MAQDERFRLSRTLVVYAVLAAASPVRLIVTLVVLGTEDTRRSGLAFVAGFVLGQAAGLGNPAPRRPDRHLRFRRKREHLDLVRRRSRCPHAPRGLADVQKAYGADPRRISGRGAARQTRALTPKTAFSFGVPLDQVKRLLIEILAASTIALDASSSSHELRQAAFYVVIASVLVWLPVMVYFFIEPQSRRVGGGLGAGSS